MHIVINASAVSSVKGGASFYIVNIVREIAALEANSTCTVLCTSIGKPIFSEIKGISRLSAIVPKMVPIRLLWEQLLLPLYCLIKRADLLFSPNYTMPLLSFGFKNVVTIYDLSFFSITALYPRSRRFFKGIIRASAQRADRVIAISECTKKDIRTHVGGNMDKVAVVYCAVEQRFFNTPDTALDEQVQKQYSLQRPYILFTGFLEPRKNLERLITAFAKIHLRIEHDLLIAGGNGWWYENLPDTVVSGGVKDRVRFLGYVPDEYMPSLYRHAALFAFPSLYEGFGIAALEAITCGTPVLASNNTSLPEVVGDAGIYVDPYNIDDIAEKLAQVADTTLMQTLKSRCSTVAGRFSWHVAAKETVAVFESALHPKDTP